MAEPKLERCPFCGSEADYHYECEMVKVRCQNYDCGCDLVTWFDEPEEAAAEWNRRASMWRPASDPPKTNGEFFVYDEDESIYTLTYEPDMDDGKKWGYWTPRYHPQTLGYLESEWTTMSGVLFWMPIPELPVIQEEEDDE